MPDTSPGIATQRIPLAERLNAVWYVMSLGTIDTMPIQCETIQEFNEVQSLITQVAQV